MVKRIFAGPSLHGALTGRGAGIRFDPPAICGDITRAVLEGVRVIGLVDGYFENTRAVWHKEIVFALHRGVRVFGGASIGALRAAECAVFGMVGVGVIFEKYHNGVYTEDSDVALLHGPAELDYLPVSEAVVDIDHILGHTVQNRLLSSAAAADLLDATRAVYYKDRTRDHMLALFKDALPGATYGAITDFWEQAPSRKRLDAEAVIVAVQAAPETPVDRAHRPDFIETSNWRRHIAHFARPKGRRRPV